jgi:hypothetical protein
MPLENAVDFGLVVTRITTQAGNYVVDLSWRHVKNMYGYRIYRAESPSDDPNDWFCIHSKILQVNYFQDRGWAAGRPVANGRVSWYYKVIPVALGTLTELALSRSLSVTFEEPTSGILKFGLQAIRMRTNMMLDPMGFSAAEPCHFLVRKWAGEYCSCLDERTRAIDANCYQCYGIGYKGGYELIENIYCRIRSASRSVVSDEGGLTVTQSPTATVASYPLVSDGDILIRAHNERFRIRVPKARKSQNYLTAQTFTLEKMQLSDMGYRIAVPRVVPPVNRVEGGNVIGGVLARPEGNSVNAGRGGEQVRKGWESQEVGTVDGETKTAVTTRTGVGVGRGYIGTLPKAYP